MNLTVRFRFVAVPGHTEHVVHSPTPGVGQLDVQFQPPSFAHALLIRSRRSGPEQRSDVYLQHFAPGRGSRRLQDHVVS